jgi:hypothetical protein
LEQDSEQQRRDRKHASVPDDSDVAQLHVSYDNSA